MECSGFLVRARAIRHVCRGQLAEWLLPVFERLLATMTLSVAGLRDSESTVVPLVQGINFDQGNSCGAVHATDNRRVIARREISHNRGLQIVRRRYAGRDDFGFLIASPIVVGSDERATTVMQFQRWIW